MLGAWCLESPPEGMLPGGEEGDVKHVEGEKSSCWALKALTCDCCLYLEEQKGIDVVKGTRQSWLKYSVDSCSSGDSAHCGGSACDVSGERSAGKQRRPGMRLAFCILEVTCMDSQCFWDTMVYLGLFVAVCQIKCQSRHKHVQLNLRLLLEFLRGHMY